MRQSCISRSTSAADVAVAITMWVGSWDSVLNQFLMGVRPQYNKDKRCSVVGCGRRAPVREQSLDFVIKTEFTSRHEMTL